MLYPPPPPLQIIVLGTIGKNDVPLSYAVERVVMVGFGVVVGMLGSVVIFPQHVTPKLFATYAIYVWIYFLQVFACVGMCM